MTEDGVYNLVLYATNSLNMEFEIPFDINVEPFIGVPDPTVVNEPFYYVISAKNNP